MALSRRWWVAFATIGASLCPAALSAQDDTAPPERIDILIPEDSFEGPLDDCSAEQESAIISGEIIVCRRRRDNRKYGYDAERAQQRFAEETMNKGDPRAPDFGESCAKNPEKGVCIGFGKPPPPAYIVDFDELPDAPVGSDADRIGRGLAPRGNSQAAPPPDNQVDLGLPPLPGIDAEDPVTPPGSASPAEEPSG